jgi:hypothetical protein
MMCNSDYTWHTGTFSVTALETILVYKPHVLKLLLSGEQYDTCLESITAGRGRRMRIREIISAVAAQTMFIYSCIFFPKERMILLKQIN